MADAIRQPTRADMASSLPACLITWTGLDNDDSGSPVELIDYPDKTATITGTFGAGGTIVIQGSNDGTNWFTMTDAQSAAVSKTAAAMELLVEAPRYIRPLVTAGDGTTSLTVQIMCRRTSR